MAAVTLDALLACLDLHESRPGVWTGPQLQMDYRRIFGGQLLAQTVALGALTSPGKSVKSLSVSFPREGSLDGELEFEVGQPMTGRTFATRTISAAQEGKTFFVATVSMHDDTEQGLDHQVEAPDIAGPDAAVPEAVGMTPWDVRVVDGVDLSSRDEGPARYSFWTRVSDRRLSDDTMVHQALLAHATDLTVIGTALRPHAGYSQADTMVKLHTGVTTHQMWFHRPFRIDEWLLVDQHSPTTSGGRAFGLGHVFTQDGRLVASFAQESLIRLIPQQ
jgi:acyl-CoA thioesterase-2